MNKVQKQVKTIRNLLEEFELRPDEFALQAILNEVMDLADCTTHLETTKRTSAHYIREAQKEIEYAKPFMRKGQTGVGTGALLNAFRALFNATRATIKKELVTSGTSENPEPSQDEVCPKCGHDNGWDFDVCERCNYGEDEEDNL